jgi:uncharacterized protein YcfL
MRPQRRSAPRWLALVAGLCLLTACESTPRGSQNQYQGREGGQMTAIEGNPSLARSLSIKNPLHKRQSDRLVVQFELANTRSNPLRFAWAIDWFDAAGFRIADNTRHWEPVRLGGEGMTIVQVVAPTPEAASWKLQVTSPDEVR